MRKMALLLALGICITAWLAAAVPAREKEGQASDIESQATFVLPASLREIGESAFEGTGAETVILPDSAVSVGDRAFAENAALTNIHIPESVTYIGEAAFAGSIHVTIQGTADSYAAVWAQKHNVAFEREKAAFTWLTKLGELMQVCFLLPFASACPEMQIWQRRKRKSYARSMRPQDRPELYPIAYRFP